MAYEATTNPLFQAYMKNMWHRGRVVDMTYRDRPALSLIPKATDFFGDDQKVTIKTRNPQGRSANSQKAQSNARSGRAQRFAVTRVSNHQSAFLSNETIEASGNDMGAIAKALEDQMTGAVENLTQEIAWGIYRNGGGTRGRISAITATTITLTNPRDARAFEIGQTLKCGTTDGTTATTFRSTPATAEITGINRSTGVLTFAAGTFTGTNWAANDYLSVDGDIDETTLTGKYIKGFAAWLPLVAPTSGDSFFGVDRSIDSVRLAGVRYDGRSKSLDNALIYAAQTLRDEGGKPNVCLMSSRNYANLAVSLGTRVQYPMVNGSGEAARMTFQSIALPTDSGLVSVLGDPNCPDDVAYMLEKESWMWHTLGEAPKSNIQSGNALLDPGVATDDVEVRWVYRGNLWCNAPGHNAVIQLA